MKRYALILEYLGKNYSGSQIQGVNVSSAKTKETKSIVEGVTGKKAPKTIQSELEKAISTLIKTKIKTNFSGRTDAGVNAKGQVVHFETDEPIVASRFINSLNGLLPNDISVAGLEKVTKDFHAQKSAKKRYYQYVFYNRPKRSAFDGDLMLVKYDLNIQRMQKTLEYLKGEHDFSAFRSSGSTVTNRVCFIYKASCKKLDDMVIIDIVGNRFLYNMVRTIVGTLLMIERNHLPPEFMKEVLESKDRTKAGKTVSPYGLTLMKVEY